IEASCWVARKIFLSPFSASSSARTLDSRPTTNGVIMKGKMTTSRIGIMGSVLLSNFSLDVVTQSPRVPTEMTLAESQSWRMLPHLPPNNSLLLLSLPRLLQCGHGSAPFLNHL